MEQGKRNPVSERLRDFAKDQRSLSTRAEALFWSLARAGRLSGHKFKRQVPITPYIVDFLCPSARLIVELDGEPHETAERRNRDATRDTWLRSQSFEIMRFSNEAFLGNPQLALDAVLATVERRTISPPPNTDPIA
ncbi:endonuclease domain-containing protein [Methylobacterium aquaticum]|uniref:endonuclease domain-containing protein n=1 Tax=Methylobacterium aquaticum TaxID=270351 RepID=UPI003D167A81